MNSKLLAASIFSLCCFSPAIALGKLKQKHFAEEPVVDEVIHAEPVFDDVIHAEPIMGTVTEEWAPPIYYKKPKYEIERVPIYYKETVPVYYKGKHHGHTKHGGEYMQPHQHIQAHQHIEMPIPHSPMPPPHPGMAPPHAALPHPHAPLHEGGPYPHPGVAPHVNGQHPHGMLPPVHLGDHPDTSPHDLAPQLAGRPNVAPDEFHTSPPSHIRPFNYGVPSYGSRPQYPTVQMPRSSSSYEDDQTIEWVHAPFVDEYDDDDEPKYYMAEEHYQPRHVVMEQPMHSYVPVRCGLDKMCLRLL